MRGELPAALAEAVPGEGEARRRQAEGRDPQGVARWRSSVVRRVPEMIGGSADLTGSNNTKTKGDDRRSRPATTPAATSTTASASTAWPRP
jgi:transketolase